MHWTIDRKIAIKTVGIFYNSGKCNFTLTTVSRRKGCVNLLGTEIACRLLVRCGARRDQYKMRKLHWLASAAFASGFLFVVPCVNATPVVDQFYLATPDNGDDDRFIGGGQPGGSNQEVAQTFTVGITGQLTRVDIQLVQLGNNTGDLTLDIMPAAGTVPVEDDSQTLGTINISMGDVPTTKPTTFATFTSVDLTALNIFGTAGDFLALVLRPQLGSSYRIVNEIDSGTEYSGGSHLFRNIVTVTYLGTNQDSGFRTFVDPDAVSAIPEPSTLTLFGAGLLGLALLARRRRKAA